MKEDSDKRKAKRHQCSPSLTYQLSLFDKSFNARGADYSDDGISFKSNDKIDPGAIIFVKHKEYNENCRGCRSVSFATVKWCEECSQIDSYYYKIGAKYLVPNDVSFF